ncbi:RNA 3'-terminal phosphate cyclase/enolpyruvate transferase [Dipodascopsis tothii]|uniref:RNA 3'-terminal phosphate cyclase/enolpyruvate transferase n=1 Tax=Dipodascopsis tothii TaxID=44089 RepID=UPI0034CD2688
MAPPPVAFQGHVDFRMRLVLATLAGRPVRIERIRSDDVNPGIRDYELSFLRLLENVTNGSKIEISMTGTTVVFRPGQIVNGTYTHNCPLSRGMGYYIEPLLLLAPFGKAALSVTFKGVTSNGVDIGVDTIRTAIFPLYQKFGIQRQELRILKRGSPPGGGGEVQLYLPHVVLQAQTLHAAVRAPVVAKLRGIAYSTRVSPATVNRIIEGARRVLAGTGCETFIYSDAARGDESGASPGFGATLVAETKTGWCISAEAVGGAGGVPEDVGERAARALLDEIALGGMVGRNQVRALVVLMVLGREDVGRVLLGRDAIDAGLVRLLRAIKALFGTEARLRPADADAEWAGFGSAEPAPEPAAAEYVLSIKGAGFVNASKKIA